MSTSHLISREEVMAFLDGELASPRAAIVRAHVDGCAECAATADDWRGLSQALREWRVEAAPEALAAPRGAVVTMPATSATMSSASAITSRRFWRVAPWLAAAAAVVVIPFVMILRTAYPLKRLAVFETPMSVPSVNNLQFLPQAATRDALKGDASQAQRQTFDKDTFSNQVQTSGADAAAIAAPAPPAEASLGNAVAEAKKATADPRMIVRTATLGLSTDRFDDVLKRMQAVAARHDGAVSAYQVAGSAADGRSLSATVRVPVSSMDAALTDLRALGTVTSESQTTEEITDAHRDLAIRIDNAKREAARLNELLTRQSDRLSDVLEVEQAQARVQTEIEQMTAQETAMRGRAAMSSIAVSVVEVRHAELALGPLPIGTRLRNAMVDGIRDATESALAAILAILALSPSLVLWLVLVAPPALLVWWGARALGRRRTAR